jgi:hypothetical protein
MGENPRGYETFCGSKRVIGFEHRTEWNEMKLIVRAYKAEKKGYERHFGEKAIETIS